MNDAPNQAQQPAEVSGRYAAFVAVRDVLQGRGFAGDKLAELRSRKRLDRREAGLAMEIATGTVRHVLTIDHLLGCVADYDPTRVSAPVRAVLSCAAYQLIWMDRIPEFAAVNEAVTLTRTAADTRAAGMVNAVLRRLTRAIAQRRVAWERLNPRQVRVSWDQACAFNTEVLPNPDREGGVRAHLAAATGERLERYHKLAERFGDERAERIAWASQAVPIIAMHRNVLRVNPGVFQERVREEFGHDAEWTPDVTFLPASTNVAEAALFTEGRAYIQDVTAHTAAQLLGAQPGESVLDFCAAPGGKSIALAMRMLDRGEVVACDAAPARIVRIRENMRRLRLTAVRTHLIKTSDASDEDLRRSFDAALVDVPCSNSGVFARRPEARLGWTAEKLASLVRLQRALLERASAAVRVGGRLVYSTCSTDVEENEEIVQAFLKDQGNWRLDGLQTMLPQWGPNLADWRDGGFAARLVRERA